MPFWPREVLQVMESNKMYKKDFEKKTVDEDILFLKSMMSNERKASYAGRDKILAKTIEKRNMRKLNESESKVLDTESEILDHSESDDSQLHTDESADEASNSVKSKTHRRTHKTGTTANIPHNILRSPLVSSYAVRNNISATVLSGLVESVTIAGKGSTEKVTLSASQSHRHRQKAISEVVNGIKSGWIPPHIGINGIVHWEGKLMSTLSY